MSIISRTITTTLSVGVLAALFISNASAGCGDISDLRAPFQFGQPVVEREAAFLPESVAAASHGQSSASIVGLWKVQLLSMGNGSHNPAIPDGALIDFGYTQWHSDGTEILNSGGHAPSTQNFCLGVWGQTGFSTYQLNHFPINYNATTGAVANYIQLREQVTLSPSGYSYSGTFTIDVFDPKGTQLDHLSGTVVATRLTVDSTYPGALPTN